MRILLIIFFAVLFATQAIAEWKIYESKDEMTDDVNVYAQSNLVGPTKKIDFPYEDVEAMLVVACNNNEEWTYIWFTKSPNIAGSQSFDGYDMINTRVKWDDMLGKAILTQDYGSKSLHFSMEKEIIENIQKSNTFLIELSWFSNSQVYFRFPLSGSAKAISSIRKACKR